MTFIFAIILDLKEKKTLRDISVGGKRAVICSTKLKLKKKEACLLWLKSKMRRWDYEDCIVLFSKLCMINHDKCQTLKSIHKSPVWNGCLSQVCAGWVKHREWQCKLPWRQSLWGRTRAAWDFLETKMIVQLFVCSMFPGAWMHQACCVCASQMVYVCPIKPLPSQHMNLSDIPGSHMCTKIYLILIQLSGMLYRHMATMQLMQLIVISASKKQYILYT